MADPGHEALYRLYQLDHVLFELKAKAGALDTGQREAAAFKTLEAETSEQRERTHRLEKEMKSLESEQAIRQEKIKKFEKQLYDGSLSNAKEVENVQKEIEMLFQQSQAVDDKLYQFLTTLPGEQEESMAAEKKLTQLREAVHAKHEQAKTAHALLQDEYRAKAKDRAALVSAAPTDLVKVYEQVRAKTGNTGAALVTQEHRCGACGVPVTDKAREHIRAGRAEQCEQCRRLLLLFE